MPATPYATLTDLSNTVNASALAAVSSTVQQAALQRAADLMDSKFNTKFVLPLVKWQTDVVECNCAIALFLALRSRGWNPKSNPQIKEDYERWLEWLDGIGENKTHPVVTDSSSNQQHGNEGSGFAYSARSPQNRCATAESRQTRGW